jgi:hypothetical protein
MMSKLNPFYLYLISSSRLVVVNLTRKTPDFKYADGNYDDTGILEILGFGPNSMKVIEAFAKDCFI